MQRLTRKRALELTRDQWDWLAKHPDKYKYEWPMLDKFKGKPIFDCFCCEYAKQHGEKDFGDRRNIEWRDASCPQCPLRKLWPQNCTGNKSPFMEWHKIHLLLGPAHVMKDLMQAASRCAAIIANAARAELAELKKKGKK